MMPPRILVSVLAAALASSCVLERGPPAEVDDPRFPRTIEEREEPGSLITLRRAKASTVACPHCAATNPPGRESCEACGRPMKLKVFVPCPSCSTVTDPDVRAACPRCGGRGFLEESGSEGAEEPAERP
jgi:primosomal protein N'